MCIFERFHMHSETNTFPSTFIFVHYGHNDCQLNCILTPILLTLSGGFAFGLLYAAPSPYLNQAVINIHLVFYFKCISN